MTHIFTKVLTAWCLIAQRTGLHGVVTG